MNEHNRFEILCALAAVCQVGEADLRELKLHLADCADCQDRLSDFAQISAQALTLSGETYSKPRSPQEMTERFVKRARAQGIALGEHERRFLSGWSFVIGWKGSFAVALLLFAVIAGSISRSVHWRAPSVGTTTARLRSPGGQSAERRITGDRPARPRTKLGAAVRQAERLDRRASTFAQSATRLRSAQESGPLGPGAILHGIQYSAGHYQSQAPFDGRLFSSDPKSEQARLFQTSDRSRSACAVMSLNFPPHVFTFGSERRFQSDSSSDGSELVPNIDWRRVWLGHSEALRNSNDTSQSHGDELAPTWLFSHESKGEQR